MYTNIIRVYINIRVSQVCTKYVCTSTYVFTSQHFMSRTSDNVFSHPIPVSYSRGVLLRFAAAALRLVFAWSSTGLRWRSSWQSMKIPSSSRCVLETRLGTVVLVIHAIQQSRVQSNAHTHTHTHARSEPLAVAAACPSLKRSQPLAAATAHGSFKLEAL